MRWCGNGGQKQGALSPRWLHWLRIVSHSLSFTDNYDFFPFGAFFFGLKGHQSRVWFTTFLRRRNTRYKSPQHVAQHSFVAPFGLLFRVFHLTWSTCRARKVGQQNRFVAGWRNAALWLVDLLGVDLRQVAHFMKNENKGKNCCSK